MGAQIVNRVTGECVVTDDKTGRTYNLEFDIKAIEKCEAIAGEKAFELISTPPSVRGITAILMSGVEGWNRRNHGSQRPLNPNLAQLLLVGAGGMGEIREPLQLCLARGEGMGLLDGVEEEAQEAAQEAGAQAADAGPPTGTPPAS
jgi:hypothetical protein